MKDDYDKTKAIYFWSEKENEKLKFFCRTDEIPHPENVSGADYLALIKIYEKMKVKMEKRDN